MTDHGKKFFAGIARGFWGSSGGVLLAIVGAGVLIDQTVKAWLLYVVDLGAGPIRVAPVLELVVVWNRGISFGLLPADSLVGQIFLIVFAGLASLFFWVAALRTGSRIQMIGLGLIIAGALGNGLDRVFYGAVADFFHFHLGNFSWYVFNIADIWITIGAAALITSMIGGHIAEHRSHHE